MRLNWLMKYQKPLRTMLYVENAIITERIMIKFFTDKTVINDYLLVKIKDYFGMKDFSRWDEILIDPHVYELTKSEFFSWEKETYKQTLEFIIGFLDSLPEDHYFSWDYPGDMTLQYQDLFITRTWENACHLCYHPNYIVTAQYKFNDYWNFKEWFNKYNDLNIESGIMGLGNMCRFRTLNQYLKHTLDYAFSHCRYKRIHIYGLCLKAIPHAVKLAKRFNIELSVDSTNWTRCVTKEMKEIYKVGCRKGERQIFFDEYMKKLERWL